MDDTGYTAIPTQPYDGNNNRAASQPALRRRDVCSNWDKSVNKANFIVNCVNMLLLVAILVIVAVQLGSTSGMVNDAVKSVKESFTCTLINLCEGVGFGDNCRTHESIHECGLATTHGVTSAWTEYFSDFSSGDHPHP